MQYPFVSCARFLVRPNRFLADVVLPGGEICRVHVKNTGRLGELLLPGALVYLEEGQNPKRKTKYSLIAVEKDGVLFQIDSQAPNQVAAEALLDGRITEIGPVSSFKREVTFHDSRFDIAYETPEGKQGFLEVKGVTLLQDGVALFPDAPTSRGAKHLLHLCDAVSEGYEAAVLFLIQTAWAKGFSPHTVRDPAFTEALKKAKESGVQILAYTCHVTPDTLSLNSPVPLLLELEKNH